MDFALRLDQPDMGLSERSRRPVLGAPDAPTFAILNGRGTDFESGTDEQGAVRAAAG